MSHVFKEPRERTAGLELFKDGIDGCLVGLGSGGGTMLVIQEYYFPIISPVLIIACNGVLVS